MKTQRIAIVLLATIVVAAPATKAEGPVLFADPNLKQAVIENLSQQGVSTVNPTPTDMLALRNLSAGSRGIRDLTGLEQAVNLTVLDLTVNRISNLGPLSTLVNLRQLHVKENQIKDLRPLAGLTNLTYLDIGANPELSDLSGLESMTKLEGLIIHQPTKVGDLRPLSGLRSLENLQIYEAQVSDISPLSGLTNLVELHLAYNQRIADISALAGMTKLQNLRLEHNQISDIRPLAKLGSLNALGLRANNITDISPLSNLTNLTLLDLSSNKISDIHPLAGLTNLTGLSLGSYQEIQITDISALAGLTKLTSLDLGYHPIKDITSLTGLVNLVELNLGSTKIRDIRALAGMTQLKVLGLNSNQITDISVLAMFPKLEIAWLQGNLIVDLSPLIGMKDLHELYLEGNPLDGKACAVYIPGIKLNNPGIKISYDACLGKVFTLTVSATPGGTVPKPGEGTFICNDGESVPIEAKPKAGYQFTRWTGTAVNAGRVAKPDAPVSTVVVNADYTLIASFKSGSVVEDFEKGKLGSGWSSMWSITSEEHHSGKYSLRAEPVGDAQTTTATLKATVGAGRISFWRKVSSEAGADIYRFYIDGILRETLSGEYDWKEASFSVGAGSHTFTWEYQKDVNSSSGADTVYIDDVSIPVAP